MAESGQYGLRSHASIQNEPSTFGGNGPVHADKMRQELNIEEVEGWLEMVKPQIQTQTHQSQPSREACLSSMSNNMTTDHQKGLATIKPLETKSGWQRWNEDINNALLFAGFNDVLNRQPDKPTRREAESSAKYSERAEA